MLLTLFLPRLFMVGSILSNRRGGLMKIKCYKCHSLNNITNQQIFSDTKYICANCESTNLLYKYFSTRLIKVIYIITCGILPLSLALYKIHAIYFFKVPLAIVVACFILLLFFPIYKLLFLQAYNKKAGNEEYKSR